MSEDNDPFTDEDAARVFADELAKLLIPLFKAFRANGLSGPEAAALAAAYCQQVMPYDMQGPQEGS